MCKETYAKQIREKRQRLGMTQKEFADALEMPKYGDCLRFDYCDLLQYL